ncbi:hypothetical protein CIB93_30735 [Streptomyces sp. WZ.A104]|uniref:SH3 domain-containing protein n=1 Tax=Streptomyces sp. WZ.A104 TaxID=2023771 RepID=UPI000BBBA51C|nr:SH3 domain-containing protein [Streptomyces sp. WZ.A104]PCG82288.1 hypothetical protein CIB93_30735 [Streptomyces sp. WZ.A104]
MRSLIHKAATATAVAALSIGGVTAMSSPAAAAVGAGSCTRNMADYTAWTDTTVHLRSGPSTGYTSLGLLSTDTKVTVMCWRSTTWAYVKVRSGANVGKTGWVSTSYLAVQMNLS